MGILDKFSIEQLKAISEFAETFDNKEDFVTFINGEVKKREQEKSQSLNVRFNMDMFIKLRVFEPDELRVLQMNNINNLQELIDCNLDSLVGITCSIKEKLEWARKFYDFEPAKNKGRRK